MKTSRLRWNLTNVLKPELNFLLAEPPGPGDFGWFCKEHALALHALLTLWGFSSYLCEGDLYAAPRGEGFLSTLKRAEDTHMWLEANGIVPVDASVCLRYFFPQLLSPMIIGPGDYPGSRMSCRYWPKGVQPEPDRLEAMGGVIAYIERERYAIEPLVLLEEPLMLLNPGSDLHVRFGTDYYFKLVRHLDLLASREAASLQSCTSQAVALVRVAEDYSDARCAVSAALRQRSG